MIFWMNVPLMPCGGIETLRAHHDQMLLKYPIYIVFHTTKSTNSQFFASQSFKNKDAIADDGQNSDCCVRVYPGYALLFLAGTSIGYICG